DIRHMAESDEYRPGHRPANNTDHEAAMKGFHCACGQRVFFENTACLNCGRQLGFDAERLDLVPLDIRDAIATDQQGRAYRYCANQAQYDNCNWILPADHPESLCLSCGMNKVIPALSNPRNLELWTRVEEAKRRLIYALLKNGLPFEANGNRLNFKIMEDQRRNPDVLESFIATGHLHGTITINVAEADDAERHAIREQMQERYRTVLGHLRHEAGHFYFGALVGEESLEECRALFGDEREDYESALASYYENGPAGHWHEHFVSAYASAHPAEDFAETFAHVLHIDDGLETARWHGLTPQGTPESGEAWIDEWMRLSVTLNEILRSLGSADPYPFVLTYAVRRKLAFVNRLLNRQA
ncbi:MAG: putative zinc-binding metallopeptidase, partial [Xanthomonadales bacterium]|nr:putative zinc-binding metallopeptidase [Xanthomonadales bacterium]